MMELAYLVGDPEEVYAESLNWKEVWLKIACKNPTAINETSDVYINKQGYRITWFTSDKGPPKLGQVTSDKKEDRDEDTDEEDPDSQDNYDELSNEILKGGAPPEQKASARTIAKKDPAGDKPKDAISVTDDTSLLRDVSTMIPQEG